MQAASVDIRWSRAGTVASVPVDPEAAVRAVLSESDAALDYGRAKLALDRIVDPSFSLTDTSAAIDALVEGARRLAGPFSSPDRRIAALRRFVHVAGPWNDGTPFAYDQTDPMGQRLGGKLLSGYLTSCRGNCVSMPALFLILAERLELDGALATAPLHVFLRYRAEDGRTMNVEATNGGNPARDQWYREQMPMSDRAVASGLYLRTLSKREGVALMSTTVMESLIERRRFGEALDVSEVILAHAPRDGYTMMKQAAILTEMIDLNFIDHFRHPNLIPPALRPAFDALSQRGEAMVRAAEALGWEPVA